MTKAAVPGWATELMHHTGALVASDDMPIVAMLSMPFTLACVLTLGTISFTRAVCHLEPKAARYAQALFYCWASILACNVAIIHYGRRGNIFQRSKRVPGTPRSQLRHASAQTDMRTLHNPNYKNFLASLSGPRTALQWFPCWWPSPCCHAWLWYS